MATGTSLNRLVEQILRFGVVGVFSFLVDFVIYTLMCNVLHIPYLIAGFFGFSISLIVNYILSMTFVFERREDISRQKEFILFAGMSAIGLALNEMILYICIDMVYRHWSWLSGWLPEHWARVLAKFAATGVVMVYNFISRKIVLEQKGIKGGKP